SGDGTAAAEFHRRGISAAGEVDETVLELAGLDHRGQTGTLDLAARRLGDRARPHEEHATRAMAAMMMHAANDLRDERTIHVGTGGLVADLRHHVEPLRAGALTLDPHRR